MGERRSTRWVVALNCDRMPHLEGCLVCLTLFISCINWTVWAGEGMDWPKVAQHNTQPDMSLGLLTARRMLYLLQ